MKTFIYLLAIASNLSGAAVISQTQNKNYTEMVLPFIKDAQVKREAEVALQSFVQAKTLEEVNLSLIMLSKVHSPLAQAYAVFNSLGRDAQNSVIAAVSFQAQDLPAVLSYMINNGLTASDLTSVAESEVKAKRLDLLGQKVNDVLTSEGLPDNRKKIGRTGWDSYQPEELRDWAAEQIQWSVKNKQWGSADNNFLQKLLVALQRAEIPQMTVGGVLFHLEVPQGEINDKTSIKVKAPNHQQSSPTQHTKQDNEYLLFWLTGIAVVLSSIWVAIKKRKIK